MISDFSQTATGTVDVVVIGAGHCGLAVSHYLAEASIEHVILERGEVANSWRRERWDSLRLLTPNWQSRLPGYEYTGKHPDDFMNMDSVIGFIDGYARHLQAPVYTETEVLSVQSAGDGYRVVTNRGDWQTRALVIASGACNLPAVPGLAAQLPSSIQQVTPRGYRNPDQLEDGGVLVVGASATGLQLAEEIQLSGRPVTLAVGEHVRLPRNYRGFDIQWWMDLVGLLDEGLDAVDDVARVRALASPQLIGSPEHRTLDLNALSSIGVKLVGRLAGIRDRQAMFSGSLRNACALADLKMNRLLDSIEDWIDVHGFRSDSTTPERPAPTRVDDRPALNLDLGSGEIRSVVWATGYRPDYSWLDLPVLDRKGRLRHDGGVVTDAPGVYAMGLPFMRRRKSTFIHGAGDDAREITDSLRSYLDLQSHLRLAG